jgi:hypothetical protein
MKKIIPIIALTFTLTAHCASPSEIFNWYKEQNPSLSIAAICGVIKREVDERKKNLLVISRHGWSVAESEAALWQCQNEKFAAIPLAKASAAIEQESRRCDELRNKATMKFNPIAIAIGRKADAEAAYVKCDTELQAQLADKRKALAEYEAEKAQKAAEAKAQIDEINESTELPNLPLTYYNKDQAQAYMAAMNKVMADSVISRSAFRPLPSAGKNGLISTWTVNINSPRNIYAHALAIQCYQTIAGKEKRVEVRVGETDSYIFKGPLNAGVNQIKLDVWFVDDATFPVRDLIETVRCVAANKVRSNQFSSVK